MPFPGPDGQMKLGHADLLIGNSRLFLADEFPEHGGLGPQGRPRLPRAGASCGEQRGRKPSIKTRFSRSRDSSVFTEPPITFDPRPSTATGAAFFFSSVNRVSFAVRQACPRATRCAASGERHRNPFGQSGTAAEVVP